MYRWKANAILHICGMNPNLCILRLLKDTFLLGAAHMRGNTLWICSIYNNNAIRVKLAQVIKLFMSGIMVNNHGEYLIKTKVE